MSEVQIVCIWSTWYHCIPKPHHHLLPHLNPYWFYLSGKAYPGCPGKEAVKQSILLSWPRWFDHLPRWCSCRRWTPIPILTGPGVEWLHWYTHWHYDYTIPQPLEHHFPCLYCLISDSLLQRLVCMESMCITMMMLMIIYICTCVVQAILAVSTSSYCNPSCTSIWCLCQKGYPFLTVHFYTSLFFLFCSCCYVYVLNTGVIIVTVNILCGNYYYYCYHHHYHHFAEIMT